MASGKENITLNDYNVKHHNFKGKTLEQCSLNDHLSVLEIAQKYCDSSVSKTINVASNISFEDYKDVYTKAFDRNCKGLTVYRPNDIRPPIISEAKVEIKKAGPSYGGSAYCVNGACEI
jgi:hypothetical protein